MIPVLDLLDVHMIPQTQGKVASRIKGLESCTQLCVADPVFLEVHTVVMVRLGGKITGLVSGRDHSLA